MLRYLLFDAKRALDRRDALKLYRIFAAGHGAVNRDMS
jgi:hypothetical protein